MRLVRRAGGTAQVRARCVPGGSDRGSRAEDVQLPTKANSGRRACGEWVGGAVAGEVVVNV